MSKQIKERKCPFKTKYNYPYGIDFLSLSEWYQKLCHEHCPLIDACVEDYTGAIPKVIKQKLQDGVAPCPHCDATDTWQEKTEDGLSCLHCSRIIYWHKPLKKTSSRLM